MMHRTSPARGPLVFALAALLGVVAGPARSADKTVPVKFETRDGVELHGTYYPSGDPGVKTLPTVLLLHKYQGHSHADGWDSLAEAIQKAGYPVLSFDFRGHGKSTTISNPKVFWSLAFNRNAINGFNATKLKSTLSAPRDFKTAGSYLPYFVNDIAAAKLFLDERNDGGECNSRALIVIGAQEGATLGCLWMASEWYRHPASAFSPLNRQPFNVDTRESEGKDQYAGIWLSLSPSLGGNTVNQALRSWLAKIGKENKVPMVFVHGDKDAQGVQLAKDYKTHITGSDPKAHPFTGTTAIPGTQLKGSALLRKELTTEQYIVATYLKKLRDERKEVPNWRRRDFSISGFAWVFPGLTVTAKVDQEKTNVLEPVPVERLLAQ